MKKLWQRIRKPIYATLAFLSILFAIGCVGGMEVSGKGFTNFIGVFFSIFLMWFFAWLAGGTWNEKENARDGGHRARAHTKNINTSINRKCG